MTQKHFAALDGFRGIAAVGVLVLHVTILFQLPYRPVHAALAVDFFFALSGFVIAHAYDGALAQGRISLGTFARKRIVRLYPLILLGVALGAAATLLSATHGAPQPISRVLFLSLSAGLLLPAGILFNMEAFPVNTPLWSLFFEGIANVAYGLNASREHKLPLWLLGAAAALLVAVVAAYGTVGGLGFEHSYWFIGGLARVAFPFLAGVLICRSRSYLRTPNVPDWALAMALTSVLFGPSTRFDVAYDLVAILVVFPAIIACGARESSSPTAHRIWIVLGEVSYPLYAIHEPLLRFAFKLQNHALHAPPALVGAVAGLMSIIAAWAALKHYDEPVRSWVGARMRAPTSGPWSKPDTLRVWRARAIKVLDAPFTDHGEGRLRRCEMCGADRRDIGREGFCAPCARRMW